MCAGASRSRRPVSSNCRAASAQSAPDGPVVRAPFSKSGCSPALTGMCPGVASDVGGRLSSMWEIGQAVGLSSTSSVAHQLMALERKGSLRRDPHRPRAYEVRGFGQAASVQPAASYVPLVGRIAAGGPILAEESVEDVFPLPRRLAGDGELFVPKVVGDSMIEAAIRDGEATVKRFKRENGHVWLLPHNSVYEPILALPALRDELGS
ncbi:LexA family protein [Streptomyces chartreusis]|uniref:LexA family protein n=1 Tax=Streptomyces chartreusis TaxID=1969 RepID=UPI00368F4212